MHPNPRINWKRIADAVEAHAATLPEKAAPGGSHGDDVYRHEYHRRLPQVERTLQHTTITVDNLTLRFPASRPAAMAVAEKYRKGKAPRRSWAPPKLGSMKAAAFSQTTLNQFIQDREYENAEAYADLHARPVYYMGANGKRTEMIRDAEPLKGDARFISGRSPNGGHTWRVTHVASGMAASRPCETRAEAIAEFRAVDPEKVEAALATAPLLES